MRKSKTSRWRAAALIGVNLLMIAHFIQWRLTGRTISPIEPSETMHTLQHGMVNAGFIFFTLAILATLIFGRFVCGWGCHILALQDLCGWLLKKMRITPKPFRSRLLIYVPLVAALYMFVWPTAYRLFARHRLGAGDSEIHEPSRDDGFLGDVSIGCCGDSVSRHLRISYRLVSRAERLLHLRLSLRWVLSRGGQTFAAEDPRDRCLQSMRSLHGHVHFERTRPRGSESAQDGGRPRLHEVHGLRQRLSERRAVSWLRKTGSRPGPGAHKRPGSIR